MTGSAALDVVIGLIFIFLLYSLLASIIQEIIASLLGLRARNLKHGLSRMLEDEHSNKAENGISERTDEEKSEKSNHIINQIAFDTKQMVNRNFRNKGGLLKAFYEQPVIKYLASGRYYSKPSYISGSDFAKAIMDILKKHGGVHDSNIDKIKSTLSDKTVNINNETRAHLESLLDDAQNDLVKFKANLEEWFDNTMERVTGWYKRTVQFWLLVIGLVLAMSFNVNTIEITTLLSKDKEAREALVNMATNYMAENPELVKSLENTQEEGENVKNDEDEIGNSDKPETEDTTSTDSGSDADANTEASNQEEITKSQAEDSTNDEFESKLDDLLEIKAELEADIEEANTILGFRPIDSLPLKEMSTGDKLGSKQKELVDKKNNKVYVMGFPNTYLADRTGNYYSVKTKTIGGKEVPYAEFNDLRYIVHNFWGYLITALAISLGAPFWFDLLSKLIRIRTSVQNKPRNTRESNTPQDGRIPTNQRVG